MRKRKGFTLVELVIVIAVIAILAAVLLPTFAGIVANSKFTALQMRAKTARDECFSEGKLTTIVDMKDWIISVDGTLFKVTEDGSLSKVNGTIEDYYTDGTIDYVEFSGNDSGVTISYPPKTTDMTIVMKIRDNLAMKLGITDYSRLAGYVIVFNDKVYVIDENGRPYLSSQPVEDYFACQEKTEIKNVENPDVSGTEIVIEGIVIYEPRDEQMAQAVVARNNLAEKLGTTDYSELAGYIIRSGEILYKIDNNGNLVEIEGTVDDYYKGQTPEKVEDVTSKEYIEVFKPITSGAYELVGTQYLTWQQLKDENYITVTNGLLQIPDDSFLATYPVFVIDSEVTKIDDWELGNNTDIVSVDFPSSVTAIGNEVFNGCTSLTTVRMTNSVTAIGYRAFYKCSSLVNIELSSNLTEFTTQMFGNCSSLTEVTIPSNVTKLWYSVFQNCVNVENIYYDYEQTNDFQTGETSHPFYNIGSNAEKCTLHIGPNVKTLPKNAFVETGITHMEVDKNSQLETIGANAFKSLTRLKSVEIPNTVTSIASYAFAYDYVLESIYYNAELPLDYFTSEYHTFRDSGKNATGCKLTIGKDVVTVPDYLTYSGSSAWTYTAKVTEIEFEAGSQAKIIGKNAFRSLTGLTSIVLPETMEVLSDYCLTSSGITSINIPQSLKTIGVSSIAYTNISSIVLPDTLESIGTSLFTNCYNLSRIDINTTLIPTSTTSSNMFAGVGKDCGGCVVNLGKNITSIPDYFFYSNSTNYITEINYHKDVQLTSIGAYAFYNCSSLTKLIIPESVTSVGSRAFTGATNVELIQYDTNHISGLTDGNYMFSNVGKNKSKVVFRIGKNVTKIPDYLFCSEKLSSTSTSNLPKITDIEVEDDCALQTIGTYAFYKIATLKRVEIPNTVTLIGDYAFANCNYIESLYYNANLAEIPGESNYIFSNIGSSTTCTVTIGKDVTEIKEQTFYTKSSTSSSSYYSAKMTYVVFEEGCKLEKIGTRAFSYCTKLASIEIPRTVKVMENSIFNNCTALTTAVLNPDIESFGISNFWYCTSLTTCEIPSTYTEIPGNTFYNCTSLTTITISENVTTIGNSAFYNCTKVSNVYFNGNITNEIKDQNNIFYKVGASATTSVLHVGKNVTAIPNYMFCARYVTSGTEQSACFTSVVFEEGSQLKTIGDYAFYRITKLTQINIPNTVTDIGDYAFASSAITEFISSDNLKTIGYNAFQSCKSLTKVYLKSNITFIGQYAFQNLDAATTVYCQPASRPSNWDYWMFGSSYNCTVVWGHNE